MIKIYISLFLFFTLASTIKESESGINDWSRMNIGQVTDIQFVNIKTSRKGVKKPNIFYFQSNMNMIGHINKRNGQVDVRQIIQDDEKVIDSNKNSLVLWSKGRQIIVYDKETLIRGTDNRLMKETYSDINSYVEIGQKIFVLDSKSLRQFDKNMNSINPLNVISMPVDTTCLKGFSIAQSSQLHIFTWSQGNKLCFHQISGGGLIEKQCFPISQSGNPTEFTYFKSFHKDGMYFQLQSSHYYFHPEHSLIELQAKPITFGTYGAVLQNMKTFNHKTRQVQDKMYANSNRDSVIVTLQQTDTQLQISQYDEDGKKIKICKLQLKGASRKNIKRVWVNFITDLEIEIIIQFQDLQLAFFSLRNGWVEPIESWNRQQSLAYLDKVLFMKYQGFVDRLDNQYHRKINSPEFKRKSFTERIAEFPQNLVLRIQSQVKDFIIFIQEAIVAIPLFISNTSESMLNLESFLKLWKAQMPEKQEKKYGLQKYMISFTKKNTMFAIDTKTSSILWKKQRNSQFKLIALIKLKQQYEREVAISINYANGFAILQEIQQNGLTKTLSKISVSSEPSIHKISPHSLLIKSDGQVKQFDINEKLRGFEKQYYFFEVQGNEIFGWKNVDSELHQTWNFKVPESQRIHKVKTVYRGQPEALLPIPNDKRVIFKNVDFSNIAIITIQLQQGLKTAKLYLYLINGLTGNVILSEYQTGVHPNLPIDLAYDQHNAFVSYYNSKNRVYEIWSVEGFQSPAQSTLLSVLYEPARQRDNIIFRSSIHGSVLPIKNIYISESKKALLRRHMIIVTREDKLYMMNRDLLSSRRPKNPQPELNAGEGEFLNSKFPVEEYMLPIIPNFYLNYNIKHFDFSNVRFSSTDLQSTIFVFTYGVDNYLIRIAPDKPFDMLADGFNYLQLIAVLIVVTILALYFRNLAYEAKLKKPHIQ